MIVGVPARARIARNGSDRPKNVAAVNEEAEPRDARPKVDRPAQDIAEANGTTGGEIRGRELQPPDEERPRDEDAGQHDDGDGTRDARRRGDGLAFAIIDEGETELERERRERDQEREPEKLRKPPAINPKGVGHDLAECPATKRGLGRQLQL